MSTALIVVDVQNDFADPAGGLYVPNGEYVPGKVNNLLEDYETVVYTQDWHPSVTEHFEEHGGSWPEHCVAGTWGAEFHPELNLLDDGFYRKKGTDAGEDGYSAFFGERDGDVVDTGLHKLLSRLHVDEVHVVGIALDVCVRDTALDAAKLGYRTAVIVDATASVSEDVTEAFERLNGARVYLL